ncbi:hypothetical protein RHMOL_Rhmol06G0299000 [Rhododendron molle]|uniref:Uncharacterized protein n=1 Tax=Rhododendron molle TaxID=49168 RepID=A0ACC0NI12_RHOML|nr:hypothetical protein RHMOL_Rhmol06G0299000 [Rhododendron molle]
MSGNGKHFLCPQSQIPSSLTADYVAGLEGGKEEPEKLRNLTLVSRAKVFDFSADTNDLASFLKMAWQLKG